MTSQIGVTNYGVRSLKISRAIYSDDVTNRRPTNGAQSAARLLALPGAVVAHAAVAARVKYAVHRALVANGALGADLISGLVGGIIVGNLGVDVISAGAGAAFSGRPGFSPGRGNCRRRRRRLIKSQTDIFGEDVSLVLHLVFGETHRRPDERTR